MVLIWADKDHWLMLFQVFVELHMCIAAQGVFHHPCQALPRGRGKCNTDNLLQFVDRARSPAAHGNNAPVRSRIDGFFNAVFRLHQQVSHGTPADVVFGVGVGVNTLQVFQVRFNQHQATTGSGIVGIHHQAITEGCFNGRIRTDHLGSQGIDV